MIGDRQPVQGFFLHGRVAGLFQNTFVIGQSRGKILGGKPRVAGTHHGLFGERIVRVGARKSLEGFGGLVPRTEQGMALGGLKQGFGREFTAGIVFGHLPEFGQRGLVIALGHMQGA